MKVATTLALVLTPLLVAADGWHFETTSGRADGTGSRSCQRFYMKKSENWTFKMDKKVGRSRRSAEPAPQGGWGDTNNGNTPSSGGWTPPPYSNNPSDGGWAPLGQPPQNNQPPQNSQPPRNNQPPQNGGWNGPKSPPPQNKPTPQNKPPPQNNGNRGQGGNWNGPTQAPPSLRCCVKMYLDDDCKEKDNESCLEERGDNRMGKGKAAKDFKSFNVACL
jgi:hypothetical protein